MKKKLAAVLTGTIMVVALIGCGSSNTYTNLREGAKSSVTSLGQYKDLSYTLEEVSVTDDEVEEEIEAELEWYEDYQEIDRTIAEDGDVVNLDFVGLVDGEEIEDGSAEDFDLELGSGDFIPGFEEQIIGKEKGSQFEVQVTFPEDYDEDLAGKDAVFEVTLNKIQEAVPAELTDEFVQENMDCETVEEYRELVKNDLLVSKEDENRSLAVEELLTQILEDSKLKIDETDIDRAVEELVEGYEGYAEMYGMELEEFCQSFFGYGVEELKEESRSSAQEELKTDLLLSAIAKKEKLGITQQEYEEAVKPELEDYGCESIEEFEEEYGKEDYIYEMLYAKVTQYLLDQSKNTAQN